MALRELMDKKQAELMAAARELESVPENLSEARVSAVREAFARRKYPETVNVSESRRSHMVASEMVADFPKLKGLKVFGFGVGYGPLMFFLKSRGAKVRGVEIGVHSAELARMHGLEIIHGIDAADPILRKEGKFRITYSIDFMQKDVLGEGPRALAFLDNISAMTEKGGKSYHISLGSRAYLPFPVEEIKARGFRVEVKKTPGGYELFKFTKVR